MKNHIITIKGRVTREPQLQKSKKDNDYLIIPVAVNVQSKNKEGNKEWIAYYYDALLFGKQAEVYKELKKGDFLRIEGDYSVEAYSFNDEIRLDQKIIVNDISIVKSFPKKEEAVI